MAREIVVGNNPLTIGDNEFFPYVASSSGLQPSRGRTLHDAVLELIKQNPDVFEIIISTDPRYKYCYK